MTAKRDRSEGESVRRGNDRSGSAVRMLDVVTDIAAYVAGFGIVALMFLTTLNVVLRLVQGRGVAGAVELSEVTLAAIAFLAIPFAVKGAEHVSTALLYDRLPPRMARTLLLLGGTVVLLVVIISAWVAWPQAMRSLASGEARMGLTRIPIWPGRVGVAIGLTLTALQLMASMVGIARQQRDEL